MGERNVFEGLELVELSCLYLVEVDGIWRIVKIETKGIPENRDEEIKRKFIDTPEKFVEYLGFLLGDMSETYVVAMGGEMGEKKDSTANSGEGIRITGFPLYEELLKITYAAPKRIIEIKERVEGLGKEVIPEGFGEMMEVFEKTALNLIKK